ncbi:MAG: acyltransferase family protein [bacterium]
MNHRPRDHALDLLKGIAILSVVLLHLPPSRFTPANCSYLPNAQAAVSWCVLAFFFVSGRLCPTADSFSREFVVQLLDRARRLLIPCVAFSLLYRFLLALLSAMGFISSYSFKFPHDITGWALWVFTPAPPQLYFLPFLLIVQAVAMLTWAAGGRYSVLIGCFLAPLLFYLAGFFGVARLPLYGDRADLFPLYLAMFAHGFASRAFPVLVRWQGVLAVCLLAGAAAVWRHCPQLLFIAAPCVIYLALGWIQLGGNNLLAMLGRHSAGIYVWHTPIILPATALFWTHLFGGNPLTLVLTLVTTIALSLLAAKAAKQIPALWPFRI